jgi:hypothetical protein
MMLVIFIIGSAGYIAGSWSFSDKSVIKNPVDYILINKFLQKVPSERKFDLAYIMWNLYPKMEDAESEELPPPDERINRWNKFQYISLWLIILFLFPGTLSIILSSIGQIICNQKQIKKRVLIFRAVLHAVLSITAGLIVIYSYDSKSRIDFALFFPYVFIWSIFIFLLIPKNPAERGLRDESGINSISIFNLFLRFSIILVLLINIFCSLATPRKNRAVPYQQILSLKDSVCTSPRNNITAYVETEYIDLVRRLKTAVDSECPQKSVNISIRELAYFPQGANIEDLLDEETFSEVLFPDTALHISKFMKDVENDLEKLKTDLKGMESTDSFLIFLRYRSREHFLQYRANDIFYFPETEKNYGILLVDFLQNTLGRKIDLVLSDIFIPSDTEPLNYFKFTVFELESGVVHDDRYLNVFFVW